MKALTHIQLTSHKSDEKNLSCALKKKLESAEFILILCLWERILRSLRVVSKTLQSMDSNIHFAVAQLESTIKELTDLRSKYDDVVETAKDLCVKWKILFRYNSKRQRIAVRHYEEVDSDRRLTITEDNFKVEIYYPVLDTVL